MAVLTQGLKNLQRQLTTAFPTRHLPDGWIGDAVHRARTSSHNPDDTPGSRPAWDSDPDRVAEVRALDVDARLGAGVDSQRLVDHIRLLPGLSGVIRYIIHRGRIYHMRDGFRDAPFAGTPHHTHIHFEGAWSQAGDSNTRFDYQLRRMVPVARVYEDFTGRLPVLLYGDDDAVARPGIPGWHAVKRVQALLNILEGSLPALDVDGVFGGLTAAKAAKLFGGDGRRLTLANQLVLHGITETQEGR